MAGQKRKLAGEGRGRRCSVPFSPRPRGPPGGLEATSGALLGRLNRGWGKSAAPATLVEFGPSSVGPSTAQLFEDFYERLPFLGRRRLKLLCLGRRLQATSSANAKEVGQTRRLSG